MLHSVSPGASGIDVIATQTIREDDVKGRHTTMRRELHRIPAVCLTSDTTAMRSLFQRGMSRNGEPDSNVR